MREAILAFSFIFLAAPAASAQICYNNFNRQTYTSGFAPANFSSTSAVQFQGGNVLLNVGIQPLNTEQIVLPFDQDVHVKYVYRNASASHTLGWFYLDQMANFMSGGALTDVDGDGIKDFFQTKKTSGNPKRQYDGLWHISSGSVPDLIVSPNYSDGGNYPHIHNLLENAMSGGGGMVFALCDDDTDFDTWRNLAPVADQSPSNNGIPDYDVNGDGIIGNELDRVVDLGTIRGNREIVFFTVVYFDSQLRNEGLGVATNPTTKKDTPIIPWFTKRMLNPDFKAQAANTLLQKTAIGCSRDDRTCYQSRGATLGWLDQATITRLQTPTYSNLVLDDTVVNITIDAARNTPHFISAAPHSDPNRWLLALDDQPEYKTVTGGTPCSDCTSDADFNDVVFMIERTNGGEAISTSMSTEIPAADAANTTISKVHVAWQTTFPPPCSQPPGSRIDLYFSVDNGVVWRPITFSPGSTDVIIDLLGDGITGNQLRWRAVFATDIDGCQPTIDSLNLGYEALRHGMYWMTEPIPVANTLFRSSFETPAATWTVTGGDRSNRGHLEMYSLYNPDTMIAGETLLWDAGVKLAATSPNSRNVFYNRAGVTTAFSSASAPNIYQDVLPPTVRTAKVNGLLVYDFNNDGVVNDNDALFVVQWTRGFESGTTQRAWKLGAIYTSSPAVIGPPSRPWWIDGSGTPGAEVDAYQAFVTANVTRSTFALVGAQDGMIHAFAAGIYQYNDDPSTQVIETHGYFAKHGANRNYGDGSELWAFIPANLIDKVKNNLPKAANYNPAQNPRVAVDGAMTITDLYLGGKISSLAFASEGRNYPYLTAIDVTVATQPKAVWTRDWTDADFHGTTTSPSVGPTQLASGRKFVLATSSGLSALVADVYLFLIDTANGSLNAKIKLNVAGSTAQTYGVAGSPAMVDATGDGVVDRIYLADTLGRIYKVTTSNAQPCLIAQLGESVFSPIAVVASATSPSLVRLFVAGGDDPATGDTVGSYHFFGLQDDDQNTACSQATILFSSPLPAGPPKQKVWTAPVISGDTVYFATSTSDRLDPCDAADPTNTGEIIGFSTTGDGHGGAVIVLAPVTLAGGAVGGMRAYDSHLMVNTLTGGTTIVGGGTWNNPVSGSGSSNQPMLTTSAWYEE